MTPLNSSWNASKSSIRRGAIGDPPGGGIRSTMAGSTEDSPLPVLADTNRAAEVSIPSTCDICRNGVDGTKRTGCVLSSFFSMQDAFQARRPIEEKLPLRRRITHLLCHLFGLSRRQIYLVDHGDQRQALL